jgi:dUTP pyrophosphatase
LRSLYLAYPIDHAGNHPSSALIQDALSALKQHVLSESGVLTYDPGAAFTVGSKRDVSYELQEINQKAIHNCDSMLAFVPAGVKSWGVPAEVELAHQRGMNVALVTDGEPSWAMPSGPNVQYFRFKAQAGGTGGWLDATIKALDWLAGARPPKFTTKGRNAAERTSIVFAPVDGQDPKDLHLPTRAYSDDAGLDLYVSKDVWVPANSFVDVPTALRVQLPPWSWGFLVGRSSTLRKRGLMVNPGIIDTGYRGELYVGVQNLSERPVLVKKDDRLAQLIVMGNATRRVTPVLEDDLEPHARGHNGFGSSGV